MKEAVHNAWLFIMDNLKDPKNGDFTLPGLNNGKMKWGAKSIEPKQRRKKGAEAK
ncbi:MAG: hypothetical protein ABRQ27_11340 [Clostridiaceae bacterium]